MNIGIAWATRIHLGHYTTGGENIAKRSSFEVVSSIAVVIRDRTIYPCRHTSKVSGKMLSPFQPEIKRAARETSSRHSMEITWAPRKARREQNTIITANV